LYFKCLPSLQNTPFDHETVHSYDVLEEISELDYSDMVCSVTTRITEKRYILSERFTCNFNYCQKKTGLSNLHREIKRIIRVCVCVCVQDDQKVSVHRVITTQKVTSNVQNVHRQSPDIY
jgi:hypothetical protein